MTKHISIRTVYRELNNRLMKVLLLSGYPQTLSGSKKVNLLSGYPQTRSGSKKVPLLSLLPSNSKWK